jgi:hypothetical protein
MVNFVTPLLAIGFSLSRKIVFSWFEEGKSDVKLSRLEASIAELSTHEAERLGLREDDLRRITDDMIKELIAGAPQLSYVKPRFRRQVVRLDFDPTNPASSNELLNDLEIRLRDLLEEKIRRC